ncbi:hypothetical protein [Streptomyces noursei]|uniref:hypothetical protein n=1 Tax=Streptomyces noursei TaxID=1971 RepID=UPI0030F096DC
MFTFDIAPAELFDERARQFAAWGIPAPTVSRALAVDAGTRAPRGLPGPELRRPLGGRTGHTRHGRRGGGHRRADRPGTTVWLVPGATHCAAEHIRPLPAATWVWLLTRPAFRRHPTARSA